MEQEEIIQTDDLVILVHGTFASTEKGWASMDSKFINKLLKFHHSISGHYMNYTTFKWSGQNSLYERQMAAINLAEMININNKNYKRIHLIGHSHGGNVIQYALQSYPSMISGLWKLKIASWTTIGTPFYRFNGNLKMKDDQIHFWSVFISIFLTLIFNFFHFGMLSGFNWVSGIIFALLTVLFERIFDACSIQYRIDRVNFAWKKNWFGVYSKYDEAIVGLSNNLKFRIPNTKRNYPTLSSGSNLLNHTGLVLKTLIYNIITRHITNPFLNKLILNKSLGIDRPFYSVKKVEFKPHHDAPDQQIPDDLEEELIRIVTDDNKLKIESIRRLLNINNQNVFESISSLDEKNQPKLMHSIYFDNDRVILAIANHIATQNIMFNSKYSQ